MTTKRITQERATQKIRDSKKYKDKNTNEEYTLYKSRIFITFDTDGRLFRKDRDLSKDKRFMECVKVRSHIDTEFPDCYHLKKHPLSTEHWSFPNDFCFMKFKDGLPSRLELELEPYCLPIAPDTTSKSLIVIQVAYLYTWTMIIFIHISQVCILEVMKG